MRNVEWIMSAAITDYATDSEFASYRFKINKNLQILQVFFKFGKIPQIQNSHPTVLKLIKIHKIHKRLRV